MEWKTLRSLLSLKKWQHHQNAVNFKYSKKYYKTISIMVPMMSIFWQCLQGSWWQQIDFLPSSSLDSSLARSIGHCGFEGGNMMMTRNHLCNHLWPQGLFPKRPFHAQKEALAKVALVEDTLVKFNTMTNENEWMLTLGPLCWARFQYLHRS